jgi:hypothetical protein
MFPVLHASILVFRLIVSPVLVECFVCFMYIFWLMGEARVHGSHANECGDSLKHPSYSYNAIRNNVHKGH